MGRGFLSIVKAVEKVFVLIYTQFLKKIMSYYLNLFFI